MSVGAEMFLKSLAISAVLSVAAMAASAATVLDLSPGATGDAVFMDAGNRDSSQNFGTLFSLSEETELTAIDRYAFAGNGAVGQDVFVKIWSSDGASLLHDIDSAISVQDADGAGTSGFLRSRADFNVILEAGDYLIGVTGQGSEELGQGLLLGGAGTTFRFEGDALNAQQAGAYASIRVFGQQPTTVPLPAGLPLLFGALVFFGVVARRRAV